jgi:D-alanyl-D-alanine carboxypeptidase/D-alanyl-D-alanine-endopeptidase (penicillin-binding protein 4)
MSRRNLVSARLLVDLMRSMYSDKEYGRHYRESLSVAGQDGTLKRRFNRDMKGQVYGKSGYINKVSTLSGYIVYPASQNDGDRSERVVAFSLLFNNFTPPVYLHMIKHVQDQIVRILDRAAAPAGAVQLGG